MEAIDIQLAYNSIENQSSLNNFLLNGSTVCLLPLNGSLASTGGKYDIVLTKMWKPFWLLMVTAAGKKMLFQFSVKSLLRNLENYTIFPQPHLHV